MSYYVGPTTGTKEEVCKKIDQDVATYHPVAADAFKKIVNEDLKGTIITFSASGHDNRCVLEVTSS
jgi:hypothetical protein